MIQKLLDFIGVTKKPLIIEGFIAQSIVYSLSDERIEKEFLNTYRKVSVGDVVTFSNCYSKNYLVNSLIIKVSYESKYHYHFTVVQKFIQERKHGTKDKHYIHG